MPSLLIRDIPAEMKRSLAMRAAEHERSQQAEVLAILRDTLGEQQQSWVQMLRKGAEEVGGIQLPEAQRHTPRLTGVRL